MPFSLIGSFGLLFLCNATISMPSLLGFLMLVGTVVNNGILYVDTANQYRAEMERDTALIEAGATRIRPIMMTTLAALFGALPLVLSGGDGSELRQPLGITIVGGLVMSQLLTLYTTPVVYLFFDRLRLRFSRKPKQTVTE